MDKKLLPCPFCGGDGVHCETGVWWVRCDDCGADAESGDSKESAARLWNRRAPCGSGGIALGTEHSDA